jgi:DNA-binding LytR/AlgR family response regulator
MGKDRICRGVHMLTIHTKAGIYRVEFSDIFYIESEKRNVHIYMKQKEIIYFAQLKQLEEELSEEFLRIHQSYVVNMKYITIFKNDSVELTNGAVLPVSRQRKKAAKEVFLKYMEVNE